jgi:hypothetical protein
MHLREALSLHNILEWLTGVFTVDACPRSTGPSCRLGNSSSSEKRLLAVLLRLAQIPSSTFLVVAGLAEGASLILARERPFSSDIFKGFGVLNFWLVRGCKSCIIL